MKDKRDNTTATKKLDEQPTRSSSVDVDGRVFHPTTYDLTLLCRASFPARLIEGDKPVIAEVTVYRLNSIALVMYELDGPESILTHLGLPEADTYITRHEVDDIVTVVRIFREEAPTWQP